MQDRDSFVTDNETKIVILGPGAVGKSSITVQFVDKKFLTDYNPTLQEVHRKSLLIDDKPTTLGNFCLQINNFKEILDTAGQEEYESMQENWIAQGKGYVLVYAINSEGSFEDIKKIKKRIDRIKNFEKVSAILVGNKCDLPERKVTTEQGRALAQELGMLFIETSAKTGMNCDDVFMSLVRDIRSKEAPSKKEKKDKGFFKKLFSSCNLV